MELSERICERCEAPEGEHVHTWTECIDILRRALRIAVTNPLGCTEGLAHCLVLAERERTASPAEPAPLTEKEKTAVQEFGEAVQKNVIDPLVAKENARIWGNTVSAEPAPDVVEAMLVVYSAHCGGIAVLQPSDRIDAMTAAYQVARQHCEAEMLAEPTDSEIDDVIRVKLGFGPGGKVNPDFRYGARLVIANRRKRLSQPVETLQEKVEKVIANCGHADVDDVAAEIIALVRAELEGKGK